MVKRENWPRPTLAPDDPRRNLTFPNAKPRGFSLKKYEHKTFQCNYCGKTFDTTDSYHAHRRIPIEFPVAVPPGEVGPSPCPNPRTLRQQGWKKDEKGVWHQPGG
jgi:hypothetical protein